MIISVLQPGLFWVELTNGHRLVGYALRRDRPGLAGVGPGQHVCLELSPFDLSKGRVRMSEAREHES